MRPRTQHPSLLFVLIIAATLLTTLPASAQIGVSAAFTGATVSHSGSSAGVYGPTVGVYAESGKFLAFGGDLRGSFLNGNNRTLNSGGLGPRVALKLHPFPLQVYGEALVGFNSFRGPTTTSGSTHIDYQLLAGGDFTLLPRLDWRVFEYSYTGSSGSLSADSFSTGLVLRLPF